MFSVQDITSASVVICGGGGGGGGGDGCGGGGGEGGWCQEQWKVAGSDDGGHSDMWQFIKMERYQFRTITRTYMALSTFRRTVKL
jgi:hypothetical protein